MDIIRRVVRASDLRIYTQPRLVVRLDCDVRQAQFKNRSPKYHERRDALAHKNPPFFAV